MSETENKEYKKTISELKEAMISITAIINKHGSGELIFGISPTGKVIGVEISEKTIRKISQKISNSIEPRIYPEITNTTVFGKNCILVKFMGDEPLYYTEGKPYIRVGDEDRKMSAKEIEKRILAKSNIKWDSKISETNIEDVNEQILKKYIEEAQRVGRINFSYTNKKNVLDKLELTKDGFLSNAGKCLFSDNSSLEVQLAIFAGKDKVTFLDIKDKTGNIFELIDFSENYIKEHINWRADLSESVRKEIPEIPTRAISEALVNSFSHRDYTAPESNKIAIYKDRIEIWNPGEFPSNFKPMDFIKKELPSILRNPKIAKILYYNKKIERWGSGLKRIYEECNDYGVSVDFKTLNYGFSIIFYREKPSELNVDIIQTETKSDTNRTQIGHKSNEEMRHEWIINYLRNNKIIKTKDIIQRFNIVKDTASRDLYRLRREGKIVKKGGGNNIWYELS